MIREPHLDDSFSYPTYSSELEKAPQVKRRHFLQAAGLMGVGLTLAPKIALAQSNEFARWRDTVNGFVYAVCNDRRAQVITSQLSAIRLDWRPQYRDFHYYYSAPIIFLGTTGPEEVVCGNGFEVNRFPFYDARCPCGSIADLNKWEIMRVINAKEVERYGCVLTPHDRRMPVQHGDHANYRKTVTSYGLDPDRYHPEAKRVYRTNKGRSFYGYQIADKADLEANVSKPARDVLLSSEDI